MKRWEGKVALVTGTSAGIGKAITKTLLKSGMKVVGCDRQEETFPEVKDELESLGELTLIRCDVTKSEDITAMFEQIKEKHGGIDVCVNNAGIIRQCTILTGKSKIWQNLFSVNVLGLMKVSKAAVESIKAKGVTEAHIINIGSLSGHGVPDAGNLNVYSATKFAVRAITSGLRLELLTLQPELQCRVSQISPGRVETALTKGRYTESKMLEVTDVADSLIYLLSLPPHAQVQDVIIEETEDPM